ncbi:hypothetical protein CDAR_209951 [Caerostris darwini]|uniref:Uncharacterized protein n=1 Tax=Caerostris darwini TaxID=1538125 RepID=A0AAV4QJZ7_9ARAC|nr:hypothetical protein CDAR_209951 [Caerostris darwini]
MEEGTIGVRVHKMELKLFFYDKANFRPFSYTIKQLQSLQATRKMPESPSKAIFEKRPFVFYLPPMQHCCFFFILAVRRVRGNLLSTAFDNWVFYTEEVDVI